jgi:opacity protein-like surface antigen
MANLMYDIPITWVLQPYVGGGIGVATDEWRRIRGGAFTGFPGPVLRSDDSGQFQWQLIGGVNFAITPQMALFADYRYIEMDKHHFNARGFGPFEGDGNTQSSNFLVGVRFFFHRPGGGGADL